MEKKGSTLYSKIFLLTLVITITILCGTIGLMVLPMFSDDMHPKLDEKILPPYSPLELAGRDVYQKEGCVGCHTQEIRPLKSEVMRYGMPTKPGEAYYDHPFLWGSKRTGPDLARVGCKYPGEGGADWHRRHLIDPQSEAPWSNMPAYPHLEDKKLDPERIRRSMDGLGFPYKEEQIKALENETEMTAIIAFLQWLGKADCRQPFELLGEALYSNSSCIGCHQEGGKGTPNFPALNDDIWLGEKGEITDAELRTIIEDGVQKGKAIGDKMPEKGGMPGFKAQYNEKQILSLVEYIRSLQK